MQSLTDAGPLLTFYFESGAHSISQVGLELDPPASASWVPRMTPCATRSTSFPHGNRVMDLPI